MRKNAVVNKLHCFCTKYAAIAPTQKKNATLIMYACLFEYTHTPERITYFVEFILEEKLARSLALSLNS